MRNNPVLVARNCRFCGQTFMAKRSDAKFCSNQHRQAFYRWRKKISYLRNKANYHLRLLSEYLDFPDSKPEAARTLHDLERSISETLRQHNVRIVK